MQNLTKYKIAALDAKNSASNDIFHEECTVLKSGNIKKFYSFINSKLSSKHIIPPLNDNGSIIESSLQKAEIFQKYFSSVFVEDDGNLPCIHDLSDTVLENLEITETDVLNVLLKLPNKISTGPDGFCNLQLKKIARSISAPLSFIFNVSIQTARLPGKWLTAKVIPVYKNKGENSNVANYRPISLTSVVCKVLETIIKQYLMNHLLSCNLISSSQHGFLAGRSTVSNLQNTLSYWANSKYNKQKVHNIYIDFSKAFDSISHPKLLYKLTKYGINGKFYEWISAFLHGRNQYVDIDGSQSEFGQVSSGVPQGSVLGPILFIIYVDDIFSIISKSHAQLYADDLKLSIALPANCLFSDDLQKDLNKVYEWSIIWQLPISTGKCSVFVMGGSHDGALYKLGSSDLPTVEEVVDLGINFTGKCIFSNHCFKIATKAARRAAAIHRAFKTKDASFLTHLFTVYVRPMLEYATTIWSPYLIKDIDIIESVQRRYTKRIPAVKNLSYTDRLFELNLESLEYRRLIFDMTLGHQILHQKIACNFDSMFKYSPDSGTRSHIFRLIVPMYNLIHYDNLFPNRFAKIWNELPADIVTDSNLHTFIKKIKTLDFSPCLRGQGVR